MFENLQSCFEEIKKMQQKHLKYLDKKTNCLLKKTKKVLKTPNLRFQNIVAIKRQIT